MKRLNKLSGFCGAFDGLSMKSEVFRSWSIEGAAHGFKLKQV